MFAALGDPTRLKLVAVLCVGGIFSIAQMTANTDISRQGDQTPSGAGGCGRSARREDGSGAAMAARAGADRGSEVGAGGDREAMGGGVGETQGSCRVAVIAFDGWNKRSARGCEAPENTVCDWMTASGYRFVSVKIVPSRLMSTRLRKLIPSKAMGRLLPSMMTASTPCTASSPTRTVSSLRR